MSTNETTLTAHLATTAGADAAELLMAVDVCLSERFDIGHTTVQLEPEEFASNCGQGRAGVV